MDLAGCTGGRKSPPQRCSQFLLLPVGIFPRVRITLCRSHCVDYKVNVRPKFALREAQLLSQRPQAQ